MSAEPHEEKTEAAAPRLGLAERDLSPIAGSMFLRPRPRLLLLAAGGVGGALLLAAPLLWKPTSPTPEPEGPARQVVRFEGPQGIAPSPAEFDEVASVEAEPSIDEALLAETVAETSPPDPSADAAEAAEAGSPPPQTSPLIVYAAPRRSGFQVTAVWHGER